MNFLGFVFEKWVQDFFWIRLWFFFLLSKKKPVLPHPRLSAQRRFLHPPRFGCHRSPPQVYQHTPSPTSQPEKLHSIFNYHNHLQYLMNAKPSQHRLWPCHENGLIETIQTIFHNLYVSVKLTSLFYCGLRLILVYPNHGSSLVKESLLDMHI